MHSTPLRRTALVGILVAAIGAMTFTGATAASADTTAESWADLNAQLFAQSANITLAPPSGTLQVDQGNAYLKTYDNVTIDLNGNHLIAKGIIMTSGTTLTITDSSAGQTGVFTDDASTEGTPGIVDPGGSAVIIQGGEVDSTGAYDMPAIGSGNGVCDPIDLSECRAQSGIGSITVDGGVLNATAGGNAAALGGGNGQPGTSVIVGSDGVVNATASSVQSVIGAGNGGSGFGSLDVAGTLNLTSGSKLDVPIGASATVESTGVIAGSTTSDGEVDVEGSLANGGVISTPTVTGQSNISGNNFLVTFDSNSAHEFAAIPGADDPATVRVFAPTFATGNRAEPTDYTARGDYVSGWTNSSTVAWNTNSTIVGSETVTAKWSPLDSLTLSSSTGSAPSGTSVGLTVTGNTPSGGTNDQTPFVTIASSVAADTTGVGSITLHGYGSRQVTAREFSEVEGFDPVLSNAIMITGTGTLASHMTLTPLKTVRSGFGSTFEVSGDDASGTNLGNITNQVTWSGLSTSKGDSVDPDSNEPVFGRAGTRTVKATIGTHSVSTTVKIVGGIPATLAFVKPTTTATAGTPAAFTVNGFDAAGNALGNVTNDSTFGVQDAVGAEGGSGNLVTFTQVGARVATVRDGGASATTPVTVSHGAGAQFNGLPTNGPPFDPSCCNVTAGDTETYDGTSIPGFSVQDAYGNVFDAADLASTLKISFASYPDGTPLALKEPVDKDTVTYEQGGEFWVDLTDGSATYELLQNVSPADSVPGKLTFNYPTTTQYVGLPFTLAAWPSDAYGNGEVAAIDTTVTATAKGATITPTGASTSANVTLTTTGKHTITAKAAGYTTLSQTFTAIKDTSTPVFPTTSITASVASQLTVTVPQGGSGVNTTGSVTLHYGTKSIKQVLSEGDPSVATFDLPALKVGKYPFYASYSGDGLYNAKSSAKSTVDVVPGVLDHIAFVKAPTSTVAGQTVDYSVNGYDINNNLIDSETFNCSFTLTDTDTGNGEGVGKNEVTFADAGSRTVTATDGPLTVATTIVVKDGAPAFILTGGGAETVAGDSLPFTTEIDDAEGNDIAQGADAAKLVKITSSVSSDKVVKNVVTFTKSGPRVLTFKYSTATPATFNVGIDPATAVPNKYIFDTTTTKGYIGTPFSLQVDGEDQYGNSTGAVVGDPEYATTGTGVSFGFDGQPDLATFSTLGNHTVTATYNAVVLKRVIDVVKDTASIGVTNQVHTVGQADTVIVTVAPSNSSVAPTGSITVHFGSHTATVALATSGEVGTATQSFTDYGAGTVTIYVTYSGDANFTSGTSAKQSDAV